MCGRGRVWTEDVLHCMFTIEDTFINLICTFNIYLSLIHGKIGIMSVATF